MKHLKDIEHQHPEAILYAHHVEALLAHAESINVPDNSGIGEAEQTQAAA